MNVTGLTYAKAGVDIDRGSAFIDRLKGKAATTLNPLVLASLGGFAGAMELPSGYEKPVLVASADGVGSKLKLALMDSYRLHGVGIDLVAMVVNDIVCCGARPLFFLDYLAANRLRYEWADYVMAGVADALGKCGTVLLGGETAELPGTFANPDEFDIAGFGVGIVEKDKIIDGYRDIKEGDVVIGISASGPHSNGYSLIRMVLEYLPGDSDVMDALMKPTVLYAPAMLDVLDQVDVHGVAHITGGGLLDNVTRVLDSWLKVVLDVNSWDAPPIFEWLQKTGNISFDEMYRVFNMGIGMAVVLNKDEAPKALNILTEHGLKAQVIGQITKRLDSKEPQVVLG